MIERINRPVGVCTVCRAYSRDINQINGRCGKENNHKRCQGVMRSALGKEDWTECRACNATGKKSQIRCDYCDGWGWIYSRK